MNNEERKVFGDCVAYLRNEFNAMTQCDYKIAVRNSLLAAESLLSAMPEKGAWYPSAQSVRDRGFDYRGHNPHDTMVDQIIRAAIDLYRERGGAAGGEVVCAGG